MADLITAAEYNAANGTSYSTTAGQPLPVLVTALSKEVRRYCGRDLTLGFEAGTWTQTYDGDGTEILQLVEFPLASITSIAVIDNAGNSTTLASTDYRTNLLNGQVYRLGARSGRFVGVVDGFFPPESAPSFDSWGVSPCWNCGFQNISAVYVTTAGVPVDLKWACYRIADWALKIMKLGPFRSEKIGDYSYELAGNGVLDALKKEAIQILLAPFCEGVV